VSEDELLQTIDMSLRSKTVDRRGLGERVRARFGRRVFEARIAQVAETFL
jgi:hypothetical protein